MKFSMNPLEDLKVDVTNINEEFSKIGLLLYRYTEVWEAAREKEGLLKHALEEAEGSEYIRFKTEGEKVTVDHLKALVQTSKKVKEATESYLAAKRDSGTLYGVIDGLRKKADALVTIGANIRAENK